MLPVFMALACHRRLVGLLLCKLIRLSGGLAGSLHFRKGTVATTFSQSKASHSKSDNHYESFDRVHLLFLGGLLKLSSALQFRQLHAAHKKNGAVWAPIGQRSRGGTATNPGLWMTLLVRHHQFVFTNHLTEYVINHLVVFLHPRQVIFFGHTRFGVILVQLAHQVLKHGHVLFHMHMSLAGLSFFSPHQNCFGFVAKLLHPLYCSIAPTFSKNGRRQQHRCSHKQKSDRFHGTISIRWFETIATDNGRRDCNARLQ
ncbi:hypothetical protein WR25_16401 [Diploscapter pachys]|uniref:Secreted protein n=1 Tax=Diploscapter pachys TaxID=2018661 RepID=A0A2A2JX59_9BILA|nr:hypothetical protein WR25_16401 [Diploscapter pachys]